MTTYILVNEEGDRQVVDSSSENGELSALLDDGYNFADESADEMVAMLADDGEGQQTVDHVPARNLLAYQRDMTRTTGRRPMIITGDSGVREYVDNVRNMEARAQRVRELSNSWEGLGVGLGTGFLAPFIAAGQQYRQHVQGREPSTEIFGYNLSEIAEARPFSQVAGNIIGMIGTGGAGAIGGAGIRAAQYAGRLGANRAGQVAAGLAVEEALWTAGSTLPLAMMEGQPELSAEALLGGAAFGGAVGLVFSPYLRAAHRAGRAGESQIFREVAATPGAGPMQQLIELNRNPPIHARAPVVDPEADELASLISQFPDAVFPGREARAAGAPLGGRLGGRAFLFKESRGEIRMRNREATGGMPARDRADYRNEQFVRDNMIPNQSADPDIVTRETLSRDARNNVIQPTLRRFQDLFSDAAEGLENLPRTVYGDLAAAAPGRIEDATQEFVEAVDNLRRQYALRDSIDRANFEATLKRRTARARKAAEKAGKPFGRREIRAIREKLLKRNEARVLKRGNLEEKNFIMRLRATSENLFDGSLRATSGRVAPDVSARALVDNIFTLRDIMSDSAKVAGRIPGLNVFERNLQELMEGTRGHKELRSAAEAGGTEPSVFSDALHARFRTINAAYALRHDGGAFSRIMKRFGADDWKQGQPPKLSAEKLRKFLESKAADLEEFNRAKSEIVNDLGEINNVAKELNSLLNRSNADFDRIGADGSTVGAASDLDEFFRIERAKGKHAANMKAFTNQVPTSAASHGLAQSFGGFVGTLIDPLLGWLTGGAAAVTALSMREMDKNPAQYLLMQGKVRNRLLEYGRGLDKGRESVGSRLRSAARVATRGPRVVSRGLGFAILDETMSREERIEQYQALRERFTELSNDPIALTDELEMSLAPLEAMSPEIAHYMRERAVLGVQYMAQSMTPPTIDPLSAAIVEVPPSLAEVDAFTRRFRALQDPLSILDDLANGLVTAEAAETVRVVYPSIMADISSSIAEEIMEMGPQAANIPYQMRTNLSLMLGTPTHTTLDGSFVRAMNERFAQTPQQAAAQGLNRMRTRRLNVSSGFITEGQALSER